MAAVSGTSGSVTLAGGYVTNPFHWTGRFTAEEIDASLFGTNYYTPLAGQIKGVVDYECRLDGTTALPLPGVTGAGTFVAYTGRQYSGTSLVVLSAEVDVATSGGPIVRVSCTFAGTISPA